MFLKINVITYIRIVLHDRFDNLQRIEWENPQYNVFLNNWVCNYFKIYICTNKLSFDFRRET